MDEPLRALEQRLRASPDDLPLLRAVAVGRERAGDGRGAWRARARLARATDAVDDWRALESAPQAPRAPDIVRCLGELVAVVSVDRDRLVVVSEEGDLESSTASGERLWAWPSTGKLTLACGPDVLFIHQDELRLVDRSGADVAVAPFTVGARSDRPAGFTSSGAITADRLVLRHWAGAGYGARSVIDVGHAFGGVVGHVPLEGGSFGREANLQVLAARILVSGGSDGYECFDRLDAARAAWSARSERIAAADARGVVGAVVGSDELVERDLRTGARRWSATARSRRLALGEVRVVVLGERLEARDREAGSVAWSAEPQGAVDVSVLGADLLVLHALGDQLLLSERDLTTGDECWRVRLAELEHHLRRGPDALWGRVTAGDGAVVLTVGTDDAGWGARPTSVFIGEAS